MAFPQGHRRKQKGVLTAKTRLRIEMAIRLEMSNLGLTDSQIAQHIGIKPMSYARIKKLPVYIQLRSQFTTGFLSAADQDIYDSYKINREKLEMAVPTALENLYRLAAQKNDQKIALAASCEILDRHGKFAKVSRTGAPTQEQGGAASSDDNEVAKELLSALQDIKNNTINRNTGT